MFYEIICLFIVPPQIKNPSDVMKTVTEGDELTLYCTATGYPAPNITWSLPSGQSYETSSTVTALGSGLESVQNTLVITDTTVYANGPYRCNATNQQGYQELLIAQVAVNGIKKHSLDS